MIGINFDFLWKWNQGIEESVANRSFVFYTFIASLDEYQVRDLNDLINRRFREKRMWEERIKELGGPNYTVRRVHPHLRRIFI